MENVGQKNRQFQANSPSAELARANDEGSQRERVEVCINAILSFITRNDISTYRGFIFSVIGVQIPESIAARRVILGIKNYETMETPYDREITIDYGLPRNGDLYSSGTGQNLYDIGFDQVNGGMEISMRRHDPRQHFRKLTTVDKLTFDDFYNLGDEVTRTLRAFNG